MASFKAWSLSIPGSEIPIVYIVFESDKRGSGDPQRRRPDITRAQTILDWQPKVSLREGLDRTIPYFREQLKLI